MTLISTSRFFFFRHEMTDSHSNLRKSLIPEILAVIVPTDTHRSPCSMNKKLLLIKAHYFVFNAGIASSITFASTIAKQIGYSAVTVGCMYTVLPLMGIITKILCSALADKFRLRKLVFFLAVLVSFLCSFVMIFISTVSPAKRVHLICHDLTYINSCNNMVFESRIDEYMSTDPHSVVRCEVDCVTSAEFNDELCAFWHLELRCDKNNQHDNISRHHLNERHYVVDDESSTVVADKAEMEQISHDRIRFFATLPKGHIHTTGHCINARINETRLQRFDEAHIPICKRDLNVSCIVKCNDVRLASILGEDRTVLDDFVKPAFWILFVIFALNWSGMALTNSMSDTVCFDILGNEPEKFGTQRMFGALGWGLMTVSSGTLVDWFSGDFGDKDYRILFYIGCIVLGVDLYIIYLLKVQQKVISVSVFRDVRMLFYNSRTIIFTVWCILTGILMGVSWEFLFWHLEDISDPEDLLWSKTLQGLDSLFTTVIGELPFFVIAGKIIELCGYIHSMTIVLVACALRMFFYAHLPAPVWVLPVEFVSGFTFSMCYVLIASYSSLITIPGSESTVQGLFSAMFDCLGVSLGGLIGGFIYHKFGGSILFALLAYVCLLAAGVHFFVQRTLKPRSTYNSQPAANGNLSAHYTSPNDAITILDRP